jgi:hypothetical protein
MNRACWTSRSIAFSSISTGGTGGAGRSGTDISKASESQQNSAFGAEPEVKGETHQSLAGKGSPRETIRRLLSG